MAKVTVKHKAANSRRNEGVEKSQRMHWAHAVKIDNDNERADSQRNRRKAYAEQRLAKKTKV